MCKLSRLHQLLTWEPEPFVKVTDWPFGTPEPNLAYIAGLSTAELTLEGEHVLMTALGPQGLRRARRYMWWLSGRYYPAANPGLTPICGETRCVKWNHLGISVPTPKTQKPKPIPQPTPPKKPKQPKPVPEYTDRTKCMTAKVWYPTQASATRAARTIKDRNPGQRHQYAYQCDLHCGGYHLTKTKPSKYNPRKVGAW